MDGSVDAVVVGAGFAGLYAIYRLREAGLNVRGFEAGDDVGGTWFWNRYPGARCDVESLDYSYSFSSEVEQHWNWTEKFAAQPEILRYIEYVAARFDLKKHFSFGSRVETISYDADGDRWKVVTDRKDAVSARFCILATGALSVPVVPELPGLSEFGGRVLHTALWPGDVDFTGQRVAIVGTGSSGIQSAPVIARSAAHLHVLQRTANFSVPAFNSPLSAETLAEAKRSYRQRREASFRNRSGRLESGPAPGALEVGEKQRQAAYEAAWAEGGTRFLATFSDLLTNEQANQTAADFVRSKISATVREPDVAAALSPSDHAIGAKRICTDSGYYSMFNRDNVTLVNLKETPIVGMAADSIVTSRGAIVIDTLVLATGFDAITGSFLRIDIRGAGGRSLREAWADGPRTYLGIGVHGFPNLFLVNGPGSPSVLANMVLTSEQQINWIADCITHVRETGHRRIEATAEAQAYWSSNVRQEASRTLMSTSNSWYTGSNIQGKPKSFMPYCGGFAKYIGICLTVSNKNYEGFIMN